MIYFRAGDVMEVTQAPHTRSSDNHINNNTSPQTAHSRKKGAEFGVAGRFNNPIPRKRRASLARIFSAALLTALLLTLVPVKAEYQPAALRAAGNTWEDGYPESANGVWDEGFLPKKSGYARISAFTQPLATGAEQAQSGPEQDVYASITYLIELSTIPLSAYESYVDYALSESFRASNVYDDAYLFDIPDAQDVIADEGPDEYAETEAPDFEVPAAHQPFMVGPSLESLAAAMPRIDPPADNTVENDDAAFDPATTPHDSGTEQSYAGNTGQDGGDGSSQAQETADAAQPSTASTGSYIWPAYGNLTSPFGYRQATVGSSNHKGIDICANSGDPIYAADAGEVVVSEKSGAYGNVVEIKHDNGHKTLYAHCSSLLVSVGERVAQGQIIALMGRTGRATAVHLHFELIINGENVNPELYLKK